MAVTYSKMPELGTRAPAFQLPVANPEATEGRTTCSLNDYAGAAALVVVFTCNHCPYAQHVEPALLRLAQAYREKGVQFIAICSNDPVQAPGDRFEKLAERARAKGYTFPYLQDPTQEVARAYGALCTPDPFVYDRDRTLVYRGRLDETRPGQGAATGRELQEALDELLENGTVTREQVPSMGCNIKWKPGNEPA